MKKRIVFFVLAVLVIGLCGAQNNTNEQKIIGAWVNNVSEETWVFNADGTLSVSRPSRWGEVEELEWKFVVADAKLAISDGDVVTLYDISTSSNGTTLILQGTLSGSYSRLNLETIYWFSKQ
jgi:hypothetical protein